MSGSARQARLTSEDLESFLKEAVMPRTSLALSVATLICSQTTAIIIQEAKPTSVSSLAFLTLTHTSHAMSPGILTTNTP